MSRWLLILVLGVLAWGGASGCSVNPTTGKTIFVTMSWEQEAALGLEAGPQFTAEYGGEVPDAEARAYVNEVGQKLLAGVEEGIPDLPWSFTLLDSDVINAFALPGGQVFFSRGLAEKLTDEAEMAGVIGHEIGHVTAQHGNQRVSRAQLQQFGLALAAGAVSLADEDTILAEYGTLAVPVLAVGSQTFQLKYGRDEELEADYLGMRYMARAGYDPAGQRDVMEVLRAASGGGPMFEWFATHPAADTRISRINELLAGEFASTQASGASVRNTEAYERRMLTRLRSLGPARHGIAGLGDASLWCVHCRLASAGDLGG